MFGLSGRGWKGRETEKVRALLVCNLSSLNFHYSSLKIPQFSKPSVWHLNSDPVFNFKNKPKVAARFHQKKICPFVKHCGWVCGFNYENAIITLFPELENT